MVLTIRCAGGCGRVVGEVLKGAEGLELLAHLRIRGDRPRRVRVVVPHFFEEGGWTELRCAQHNLITVSRPDLLAAIDANQDSLLLKPS